MGQSRNKKDAKRLKAKHVDLAPTKHLINLVLQNTPEALEELRRRHSMHDPMEAGPATGSITWPMSATDWSSGEKAKDWRSFSEQARTTSCLSSAGLF